MSGASIAAKVNRGLAKAASKVGFPAKVYRVDNYFNPLEDRNYFSSIVVGWSVDDSFKKTPADELAYYKLYASSDNFKVGDFVHSESQCKTFVVVELEQLRTPAAVLVNDKITVHRTIFTPSEDVKTKLVEQFIDVPCAISWKQASASNGGLSNVSTMKSGLSQVEVWTWMPTGSVKIDDVLEIDGKKFKVDSCQSTNKGTKISAISTVVGK